MGIQKKAEEAVQVEEGARCGKGSATVAKEVTQTDRQS